MRPPGNSQNLIFLKNEGVSILSVRTASACFPADLCQQQSSRNARTVHVLAKVRILLNIHSFSTTSSLEIIMPFIPVLSVIIRIQDSPALPYILISKIPTVCISSLLTISHPFLNVEILSQLKSRSNICKITYILSLFSEHSFTLVL